MPDVGIHTMPAETYHADPADRPSLSASIAHILCTSSPAHARAAHPRLNPDRERQEDQKFDIGTVAHALLLEGEAAVRVVYADDWRKKESQELRDEARANGKIPLLEKHWETVQAIVAAAREQIAAHDAQPPLFVGGKPEQMLIWQEDDVTCRARLDWLRDDHTAINDLKTTSRSANPDAYSRALYSVGGDIQAAMYVRGVERLTGIVPAFYWCVIETSPPYALSVIAPGPDVLALGEAKVEWAIGRWRECLERDEWPGYPSRVCWAELPAYEEARWLERGMREVAA